MRERVTNYLELPNNPTSFCRKKHRFPALRKYLYCIWKNATKDYVSLMYSKSSKSNVGAKINVFLLKCKSLVKYLCLRQMLRKLSSLFFPESRVSLSHHK